MNLKAMNMFLSEDNIKKHLAHLRDYRLKLSILEKSLPELKGMTPTDIMRSNFSAEIKNEALKYHWQIKAHEIFFDSFALNYNRSEALTNYYSSRERFAYDIYRKAMEKECGFIFITIKNGKPQIIYLPSGDYSLFKIAPVLAIDLFEHTYFLDYGFDKEKFFRNALMYLDTGRLN